METTAADFRLRHFVEEMGLLWEGMGIPRMTGRIVGWLLVCDPAHQTAGELAHALAASKGSISTNTRALIQMGLIERMALPGKRATYFRISEGAWPRFVLTEHARMGLFREAADRGLSVLADAPEARRARLNEFRDLFLFLEREYPLLLQHYAEWRAAREAE